MSLTKRHLESLPEDEQNAILGEYATWEEWQEERRKMDSHPLRCPPPGEPDEWTIDVENEPDTEELAEWALALMEEEEANDPLVKCRICDRRWPISEMNTNGECPDCQRENAPLVKPQPKGTVYDNWKV